MRVHSSPSFYLITKAFPVISWTSERTWRSGEAHCTRNSLTSGAQWHRWIFNRYAPPNYAKYEGKECAGVRVSLACVPCRCRYCSPKSGVVALPIGWQYSFVCLLKERVANYSYLVRARSTTPRPLHSISINRPQNLLIAHNIV